jgi:hypothetical protein
MTTELKKNNENEYAKCTSRSDVNKHRKMSISSGSLIGPTLRNDVQGALQAGSQYFHRLGPGRLLGTTTDMVNVAGAGLGQWPGYYERGLELSFIK